jgi:hypothetical protein
MELTPLSRYNYEVVNPGTDTETSIVVFTLAYIFYRHTACSQPKSNKVVVTNQPRSAQGLIRGFK